MEMFTIVGGSGFLGQHIIKLLQEKDDDVSEIRIIDVQPYKNNLGKLIIYQHRIIKNNNNFTMHLTISLQDMLKISQ